jgi:hypothetical protein
MENQQGHPESKWKPGLLSRDGLVLFLCSEPEAQALTSSGACSQQVPEHGSVLTLCFKAVTFVKVWVFFPGK